MFKVAPRPEIPEKGVLVRPHQAVSKPRFRDGQSPDLVGRAGVLNARRLL
jgi:hypothetical protein